MKTVLITGVTGGIGKATAEFFEKKGYRVIGTGRNKEKLDELDYTTYVTDLRNEEEIFSLFSRIEKLDLLINNAGIAFRKNLVETSTSEFDELMSVNVRGVFLCMKEALKKGADVVNVSSGAGKTGIGSISVYSASKFAVNGLTQAVSQETENKVVAVCPGGVDTKMYEDLWGGKGSRTPEYVAEKIYESLSEESGSCLSI